VETGVGQVANLSYKQPIFEVVFTNRVHRKAWEQA